MTTVSIKMYVPTKFQPDSANSLEVMRHLQFSVEGWMDGPIPITADKPRLKPRNVNSYRSLYRHVTPRWKGLFQAINKRQTFHQYDFVL